MTRSRFRTILAASLVTLLVMGSWIAQHTAQKADRVYVTALFDSVVGLYAGDQVRILGVPVGAIDSVTADLSGVRVRFWFDRQYKVPADVTAAILSPALVSARVIQLTPAYTAGPTMDDSAVIPNNRTVAPIEWDDLRNQLAKLTTALQPDQPGGVAPAGAAINTLADNLRGQGADIRESIVQMAQAFSALGDNSANIFSTVHNLSLLVSALQSSSGVLSQLNRNFSAVTGLLAEQPHQIGGALDNLNVALADVNGFVRDNRDNLGVSTDKLATVTQSVMSSMMDIKQVLHVAPTALVDFTNVYYPATASLTGMAAFPIFANPLQFICSAVEAASRLNHEQSAKLCMQYMAPILKNRQYNFLPFGSAIGTLGAPFPVIGAKARPNEVTYSEDWMRPDYRPENPGAAAPQPPLAAGQQSPSEPGPQPLPAEAPLPPPRVSTDPSTGLQGLMTPPGGGN
jgi:phospholipid/cholesterol/gamma-HCH transport system substrate-binding protein